MLWLQGNEGVVFCVNSKICKWTCDSVLSWFVVTLAYVRLDVGKTVGTMYLTEILLIPHLSRSYSELPSKYLILYCLNK